MLQIGSMNGGSVHASVTFRAASTLVQSSLLAVVAVCVARSIWYPLLMLSCLHLRHANTPPNEREWKKISERGLYLYLGTLPLNEIVAV